METQKRSITPEKVMEILEKYGDKISKEDAEIMLDLMYKFTILAINQIVTSKS